MTFSNFFTLASMLWFVLALMSSSSAFNISSETASHPSTASTQTPTSTPSSLNQPSFFQIISGSRRPRTLNIFRQWFYRLGDQWRNLTRSFDRSGNGGGGIGGIGALLPQLWASRPQPLNLQSSELKMRTWNFNTQSQNPMMDLLPDSLFVNRDRVQMLHSALQQTDVQKTNQSSSSRKKRANCNCGLVDDDNLSQPWLVAMLRSDSGEFVCTGVLISHRFLLTSTNCVQQTSNDPVGLHALLGAHHLLVADHMQLLSEQVRDFGWTHVEQRFLNSLHAPLHSLQVRPVKVVENQLPNDFVILELEKPVLMNAFVKPVCLLPSSPTVKQLEADEKLIEQQTLLLLGWGADTVQQKPPVTQSGLLRIHPMLHQPLDKCVRQWQTLLGHTRFVLDSRHICARPVKDEGDDCRTETGSPLIGQDPSGRFRLIGLAPVETRCSINPPLIFTRISSQTQRLSSILKEDLDQC